MGCDAARGRRREHRGGARARHGTELVARRPWPPRTRAVTIRTQAAPLMHLGCTPHASRLQPCAPRLQPCARRLQPCAPRWLVDPQTGEYDDGAWWDEHLARLCAPYQVACRVAASTA